MIKPSINVGMSSSRIAGAATLLRTTAQAKGSLSVLEGAPLPAVQSQSTEAQVERGGIPPARAYHTPVFGIETQGSAGGKDPPFWMSSIEMLSGVRIKAMWPSRGGRLMVTPALFNLSQSL